MIKTLHNVRCHITSKLEKALSAFPSLAIMIALFYLPTVRREVKLASIKDKDHVLLVGGGAIPYTGLLINYLTGARVDIIEKNALAAKKAKHLIKKLDNNKIDINKIKIYEGDGEQFYNFTYSVIFLTKQAMPQKLLIDKALIKTSPGTKILIRRTTTLLINNLSNKRALQVKEVIHILSSINATSLITRKVA